MTNKTSHIAFIFILILCLITGAERLRAEDQPAPAQPAATPAAATSAFRSTAFPLPRFVSLSSDEVFVRSGPGSRYPVKWVYRKKGLPVEVILEYEVWRKIKDPDGETGWVHQSLISGKRTGMIIGTDKVALMQKPKEDSYKSALLEPRVVVDLDECPDSWCRVSAAGYKGWLKKSNLWGVYQNETID